jgi:hypothetical protein
MSLLIFLFVFGTQEEMKFTRSKFTGTAITMPSFIFSAIVLMLVVSPTSVVDAEYGVDFKPGKSNLRSMILKNPAYTDSHKRRILQSRPEEDVEYPSLRFTTFDDLRYGTTCLLMYYVQ